MSCCAHAPSAIPIIIKGWGLVSPLGQDARTTFSSLREGRTIADRTKDLPSGVDPVELVCTAGTAGLTSDFAVDPAVGLAEQAAREALAMAEREPKDVHCLIGSSKGAVHAQISAVERHLTMTGKITKLPHDHRPVSPIADAELAVILGSHGYLAYHLKRRLGFCSHLSVVAACASSLTAIHQARMTLERNPSPTKPRAMLVVTTEASLLPPFIHSYRRLGVLGPLTPTKYRARPLDRDRNGFMLSEVAAAVVLETDPQPKQGQIELVDTAIASDGHDLIRTATGMPAISHVAQKLLAEHPIDLIHPHATGTVEHDPAELLALAPYLASPPDVYACKGALGHGLGASGLVSLVIACLCAQSDRRPSMPWLRTPIHLEPHPFPISRHQPVAKSIRTQAILAAGFGGHIAGAVIRRR